MLAWVDMTSDGADVGRWRDMAMMVLCCLPEAAPYSLCILLQLFYSLEAVCAGFSSHLFASHHHLCCRCCLSLLLLIFFICN